jgi:hypothetical protein
VGLFLFWARDLLLRYWWWLAEEGRLTERETYVGEEGRDDGWCDGRTDCCCIEDHCVCL